MIIHIASIKRTVARYFGVSIEMIDGHRRHKLAVVPRHVAIYFAHILTTKSSTEIGRMFGGRDHSTILSAVRRVRERTEHDATFKSQLNILRDEISLNQYNDQLGRHTNLDDVSFAALCSAIRQAKTAPGAIMTGSADGMVKGLNAVFNEELRAAGETALGTMIQVLCAPNGSWSLIEVSHDGTNARLIAAGKDWASVSPPPSPKPFKRPSNVEQPAPVKKKNRQCLRCKKPFWSETYSERVCKTCRNTKAWRAGADAREIGAGL